jgi:hypothetical protein
MTQICVMETNQKTGLSMHQNTLRSTYGCVKDSNQFLNMIAHLFSCPFLSPSFFPFCNKRYVAAIFWDTNNLQGKHPGKPKILNILYSNCQNTTPKTCDECFTSIITPVQLVRVNLLLIPHHFLILYDKSTKGQ